MWADNFQTPNFKALTNLLTILCFTLQNKFLWNNLQSALLAGRWWKVLEVKKDRKKKRAERLVWWVGNLQGQQCLKVLAENESLSPYSSLFPESCLIGEERNCIRHSPVEFVLRICIQAREGIFNCSATANAVTVDALASRVYSIKNSQLYMLLCCQKQSGSFMGHWFVLVKHLLGSWEGRDG